MNASLERRITVACCWASSRISVLDCLERYEDSYAVSQEFCEWITGLGQNDEHLEASVLPVPLLEEQDLKGGKQSLDEPLGI